MGKEIKQRVIDILDRTFQVLDRCYFGNDEATCMTDMGTGSRLIFPCYSNGERRVSEQELRFLFVEQLNAYCRETGWKAFYSVETPTILKYRFPKKEDPKQIEDGRSAMIDLCIHNEKGARICLIEFKALNPERSCYKKDFLKLSKENGLAFFVQFLEKQDCKIMKNIVEKKIGNSLLGNINYVCHTVTSKYSGTQYISSEKINKEGWKEISE